MVIDKIFVFEYQAPQRPGGSCTTHFNTSFQSGRFLQPIGSNGYLPVSILPRDITMHPKWSSLMKRIWDESPRYEDVVRMTYEWVFENAPDWAANIKMQ